MKKDRHLILNNKHIFIQIIFGMIFLMGFVSAFDEQLVQICGGDEQLLVTCFAGDSELGAPIGTPQIVTTTFSGSSQSSLINATINITLSYDIIWQTETTENLRIYTKNLGGNPIDVPNISVLYDFDYVNLSFTERNDVGRYESVFVVGNKTGNTTITVMIGRDSKKATIIIEKKETGLISTIIKNFRKGLEKFSTWEILLAFLVLALLAVIAIVIIILGKSRKNKKT